MEMAMDIPSLVSYLWVDFRHQVHEATPILSGLIGAQKGL